MIVYRDVRVTAPLTLTFPVAPIAPPVASTPPTRSCIARAGTGLYPLLLIALLSSGSLTACGGGGGGGASNGPPTSSPVPPPVAADLSGPWTVTELLAGTGDFREISGRGVLEILSASGTSNATWRSTDTLVRASGRREPVSNFSDLTATNDGSTIEFTFTFSHYTIRCTYTAQLSGSPVSSLNGSADCPAASLRGTWSATRGMPEYDPLPDIASVDAVDFSTCAVARDGRAFCWGKNGLAELGTGDTVPRIVPAPTFEGIAFRQVSMSTGGAHACGIDTNGQAICWGNTEGGRMGDGTPGGMWTFATSPVPVMGGRSYIDIAAGGDHVCAVAVDGIAYCWGHNESGQLGSGDFVNHHMPTKVAGNILFRSITAHQLITCGIATDNSAWCWGDGSSGGLGNGTTNTTNVPVAVSGQHAFDSIQLGLWSTCGVTTTGAGYCWGSNTAGELGIGTFSNLQLVPALVTGGLTWKNISPGLLYTCGVAAGGGGYCWGNNYFGERGDGDFPANDRPEPGPVIGELEFESIDADWHTCGVTVGGDLYCWGPGDLGSVGDGSLKTFGIPTRVAGS